MAEENPGQGKSDYPTATKPTYHALDGREVLKWALLEAGKRLAEFHYFSPSLCYHNPRFVLKLEVTAFDATASFQQDSMGVQVRGERITCPNPPGQEREIYPPEVARGPISEPDRVRDKIEESRYTTRKVNGQLVDAKGEGQPDNQPADWSAVGRKLDEKGGVKNVQQQQQQKPQPVNAFAKK